MRLLGSVLDFGVAEEGYGKLINTGEIIQWLYIYRSTVVYSTVQYCEHSKVLYSTVPYFEYADRYCNNDSRHRHPALYMYTMERRFNWMR